MAEAESLNMQELHKHEKTKVIAGRYRLEQFLGKGGFGAVYRATHVAYELEMRQIAIKIAKQPMSDREARETFSDAFYMVRVADSTSDTSLRQHFVTVHDVGRCPEGGPLAGHPYVVMEFVRAGSLARLLRSGPFPLTRAMAYFDQILKAMAFMHSTIIQDSRERRPVVHRDLKPDNILVMRPKDAPDVVKVTDFGLAVEVDSLLGWVESGGDLAYLAPEAFSHNIASPQSDVYMLGVVFYEMLTQTSPFAEVGSHLRGTDQEKRGELRRLHLNARHLEKFHLLEQNAEIRQRPALGQVIRNALSLDMSSRPYRNAGELQAAWEKAKSDCLSNERPSPEPPWKLVQRLMGEAEQCFAIQNWERGDDLLRQAMEINRDERRIPNSMVVGRAYLLRVKRLLTRGEQDKAGQLANEGYQRRQCRSTCLALASYFDTIGSPLTAGLEQEAEACNDQE